MTDEQQLRELLVQAAELPDSVQPPVQRLLGQGRSKRARRAAALGTGRRALRLGSGLRRLSTLRKPPPVAGERSACFPCAVRACVRT